MKRTLAVMQVQLLVLLGCAQPEAAPAADPAPAAQPPSPAGLQPAPTAEELAPLLEAAAGMPNQIMDVLAHCHTLPALEQFDDPSLTALILVDLKWLGPDRQPEGFVALSPSCPELSKLVSSISRSRERGYVSVIQAQDISAITCRVYATDCAAGTVSWTLPELYRGTANFLARRVEGAWRIVEFQLPGVARIDLGPDGLWTVTDKVERSGGEPPDGADDAPR